MTKKTDFLSNVWQYVIILKTLEEILGAKLPITGSSFFPSISPDLINGRYVVLDPDHNVPVPDLLRLTGPRLGRSGTGFSFDSKYLPFIT